MEHHHHDRASLAVLATVVGEAGSEPVLGAEARTADGTRRPALVTDDSSFGVGTVALMALGFAGVGLLVAGGAAMVTGRSRKAPQAREA